MGDFIYCTSFRGNTVSHVNAYQFFGGVTRILVPDNLKTGVEKTVWYTPIINKTYHDMAEHYGTAVIPARVENQKIKRRLKVLYSTHAKQGLV